MSLREWFDGREVLITGVTSELGRNLLEKLLRSFPSIKVHAVLRTRDGATHADRIKKRIFNSPGYERLRQEQPNTVNNIFTYEGNLIYTDLGTMESARPKISNVSVVFHAGGPYNCLLEYCKQLPKLEAVVVATELLRIKDGQIIELPMTMDEDALPEKLRLGIVRLPPIGPAYREPMPGYVEILKAPTAALISAGFLKGRPDQPAEIIPVDVATNSLIIGAWDVGQRATVNEPLFYNALNINCKWGELVQKGDRANRKFPYPTFGIRGITTSAVVHWIFVFFFEWLPSFICDSFLYLFGRKTRMLEEHHRIHDMLKEFESVTMRPLTVQRRRFIELDNKIVSREDLEIFPIRPEIDVEAYILCAAAAVRKYCVKEDNLRVIRFFMPTILALVLLGGFCYYYSLE